MRRDPRAYLWDAQAGADSILEFTRGRSFENYLGDKMLHSAVERQFEIIGEALSQLTRIAPDIAARVPDLSQIVDFRNLLIHGYAAVDHRTVWRTVQEDLGKFRAAVGQLLSELDEAP